MKRQKHFLSLAVLAALSIVLPGTAIGGAPTCWVHSSGPLCQYEGKVSKSYVNESNWILLYFDTALPLSEPSAAGISGVTRSDAAIYKAADNEVFAKMVYSSMLSAQARDATVTIQMRVSDSGYLKIQKIWVNE